MKDTLAVGADRWSSALRGLSVALAALVVFLVVTTANAQERDTEDTGFSGELADDDSLGGSVARANRIIDRVLLGSVDRRLYNRIQRFKGRLLDAASIEFAMDYNTISAFSTVPGPSDDVWVGQLTASAIWYAFQRENGDGGAVALRFRTRHNIISNGPDFTANTGTIWAPVNMSSKKYTRINEMGWGQRFAEGKMTYIVGLLDSTSYLDTNRYASSYASRFFAQAHNSNPARAFPSNGITFYGQARDEGLGHLRVLIADGTAETSHPFRTIDDGHWFWAVEAALDRQIRGHRGIYRFTVWGRETETASGEGFTASFDQDTGDRAAVFLRYGHGPRSLTEIRDHLSTGAVLRQPFGRTEDMVGISAAWSSPWSQALRDEYALETFYRIQLLHSVEVSASFQLIFTPSASDRSADAVLGLRLRALY